MATVIRKLTLFIMLLFITTAFICPNRKHTNPLDPDFEGNGILGIWMMEKEVWTEDGDTDYHFFTDDPCDEDATFWVFTANLVRIESEYHMEEYDYESRGNNTIRLLFDEDDDEEVVGNYIDITYSIDGDQLTLEYTLIWDDWGDGEAEVELTLNRYTDEYPPSCWEDYNTDDNYEPDNHYTDATTISTNGTAQSHTLTYADQDWYRFSANSGYYYTIETHGNVDTYLYLYGTNGTTLLDEDDDGGDDYNSMLDWYCYASGTYYFKIEGYDESDTGPYTVTVDRSTTLNKRTSGKTADKSQKIKKMLSKSGFFKIK